MLPLRSLPNKSLLERRANPSAVLCVHSPSPLTFSSVPRDMRSHGKAVCERSFQPQYRFPDLEKQLLKEAFCVMWTVVRVIFTPRSQREFSVRRKSPANELGTELGSK